MSLGMGPNWTGDQMADRRAYMERFESYDEPEDEFAGIRMRSGEADCMGNVSVFHVIDREGHLAASFASDIYREEGEHACIQARMFILESLELTILEDLIDDGSPVFYLGWPEDLSAGIRGGSIGPNFPTWEKAFKWVGSQEFADEVTKNDIDKV